MPIIKISYIHPTWPLFRQTPGNSGRWGNCTFVLNKEVDECDAWVVINDLKGSVERTKCPPGRTLLVNEEPPSMKEYPQKFLSQFALIATCGGYQWRHPGIREIFPLQAWYAGISQSDLHVPAKESSVRWTYDDFKRLEPPPKKKLLSIAYSDKQFTDGHRKRHEFVASLKEHFGDRLDIFGRGFNFVPDKWDAIANYRYHIVIENSSFPHYWTEKLADAYLGWSFPIYHGCPNLSEYFDPSSYALIDIASPEQSIAHIERIINEERWERSLASLAESRRKILDEYNLFPMVIKLLELPESPEPKESVTIQSLGIAVGRIRTLLRKMRARLQFGLGITNVLRFLRKL